MIYSQGDARSAITAGGAAFTIHDVVAGEILPGRLVDAGLFTDIVRRVASLDGGGGPALRTITPVNILYSGGDRLLWYASAVRRHIWFKTGHKRFDAEMNGQVVTHPPLLFLAAPGRLSVWALGEDARPDDSTPLYLAPYYNLYLHGAMCAGNVALPKTLTERDIVNWETYFFDTEFTHSNYTEAPVTRFKGGHDALWRAMRTRSEEDGFPVEWLTPAMNTQGKSLTAGEALNL